MPSPVLSPSAALIAFHHTLGITSLLVGLASAVPTVISAQEPAPIPGASGYHLEATWKIGGDGGWDYLSLDPQAHRLYVTRTDRVQIIDTESGRLIGEVPGLDGGHGVALVPELDRGFASSGKSNTVLVFDLKTLKPIGDPVAVDKKPDAIIYDPASKHVFAFDGGSDEASVIDAATAKVVATIPLGGGPEFAAADGKGTIFVNLEDKGETIAIDTQFNTVTQRWPLAPGEGPSGLALDAANHRLFAGCHNDRMIVLDAETGRVRGTPVIGVGVDACAFDPGTGFAFASCGDGTLTIVHASASDPGGYAVVENIKTQLGARTMALDPSSHAVFLATANFEPAATPATGEKPKRPRPVPGSFVILKFAR